jgi:hypothetical protein
MTIHATFKLSRLREIGWAKWDPIGVGGPDHGWPADEYDAYLLSAAGQLWNGRSVEEVADYLVKIETEHMGLAVVTDIRLRALDVAQTMRVYVEELRS